MNPPPALVLASTSRYRRELLARVLDSFQCASPGIDESRLEQEGASAMVRRLALAKARTVAAQYPDAYVIGSDQTASLPDGAGSGSGGEIVLGKPGTEARCIEQLRRCSGRTLEFVTAVALVRERDDCLVEFVDVTRVTFRTLDEATIARYVARESPIDCAGGFKSEGLGISLCESIDSTDPSALIGLPLIGLCAALRRVGFPIP